MVRIAGRMARSGWIPAALTAIFAILILRRYEVSAGEIRRYATWLVYGVVVPGTLIWRSLRGTPRSFVEDVAAGTALGFALEIGVYIALRAADAPRLIVVWPAAVMAVFVAIPSLRRHWRSIDALRAPTAWAWTMAFLVGLAIAWMSFNSFPWYPLGGPGAGHPYTDTPYHLALAGELKHHMPPTWPYVLGEPLRHHWFPAAEMASSSWATGVELRVILERLQLFPMMAVTMVLTSLLAGRLARRWWPGPFAVISVWFVSAFTPFFMVFDPLRFDDQRLLSGYQWQSPTHLVAAALFAPVGLLVVDRFRKEPGRVGNWILITLLLAAALGSKSTIVPLFLAGMALAGLVDLIAHRRLNGTALVGGAIGGALFLGGTLALYGRDGYGLGIDPLSYFDRQPFIRQTLGYEFRRGIFAPYKVILTVALLSLGMWLMRGAGALGLLNRRGRPREPSAPFFAGLVAAGIAAFLLLGHPGLSQLYFLRSALPFVGVLGAYGIAMMVPPERRSGAVVPALCLAATAGYLIAAKVATLRAPLPVPGAPTRETLHLLSENLFKPMLVVVLLLVQAGLVLGIVARRVRWLRGMTVALVLAAVTGTGLPATVAEFHRIGNMAVPSRLGPRKAPPVFGKNSIIPQTIPNEAITAARWLRDHSNPDDVIATNAHCRSGRGPYCDNRHFWVSAYAERRVLIEGWGYIAKTIASGTTQICCLPVPYPDRLAQNDLAFREPSLETLGTLQRTYNVRWLFVDERDQPPAPELERFARLRYRLGPFVVYSLA